MKANKLTIKKAQSFSPIKIFYPNSNCLIGAGYHWALLDNNTGLAVAFAGDKLPYHPVGGLVAIESVCNSGLVPGNDFLGFELIKCYENVYKLS